MRLLAPYFDVSTIAPYAAGAIGVFSKRFDLLSVFWILSVLTMTIGNFVALRQTDIKRLLAYSSIAHAGYMLTAFVAHSPNGFHAVLFYLVVYSLANLGMFVAVMVMHAQTGSFEIAGYRGLVHRSPALAVAIGVLLWSLVGLPPSAGFVGKWKLFLSVIEAGGDSPMWAFYYSLVLIALLNSVVSLFYYVAIIRVMCFYKPEESDRPFRVSRAAKAAALAFAIPVLALQLDWQPVSRFAFGGMHIRWEQIAVGAPPSTSTGGIPETGEGQR
jgi:NADH-quinone oxidoreductase subunit N